MVSAELSAQPANISPAAEGRAHPGPLLTSALALAMLVASMYRIPLIDRFEIVKLGIQFAEVLSAVLIYLCLRRREIALGLVFIAALFVTARLLLAALTANLVFGQGPLLSLQEARFGIMLVILPLAYLLMRDAATRTLQRYVVVYLSFLVLADATLLVVFAHQDILVLGLRTGNRYFCSTLTPLLATAVLTFRDKNNKMQKFALIAGALMLTHAMLITTSRLETLLAAGFLGFLASSRWPSFRFLFYAIALASVAWIFHSTAGGESNFAGRNFALAIELAWRSLPLGVGAASDSTAKSLLELPQTFFVSDYGLLSYVIRYGILGLTFVLALVLLWLRHLWISRYTKGGLFLAVPMLIYLIFVPLLDYGSLNGAFLLAFLLLTPGRQRNL